MVRLTLMDHYVASTKRSYHDRHAGAEPEVIAAADRVIQELNDAWAVSLTILKNRARCA